MSQRQKSQVQNLQLSTPSVFVTDMAFDSNLTQSEIVPLNATANTPTTTTRIIRSHSAKELRNQENNLHDIY
jgi:hypothetical protein